MNAEGRCGSSYRDAGVDAASERDVMPSVFASLKATLRPAGGVGAAVLPNGFFANVLDFGAGVGLAISTDGVGTKVLVAEMLGDYESIGIDCVAMNVNDVLCVGAEPVALLDYLAVRRMDAAAVAAIMRGVARGAAIAGVGVPGGETAQLPELIAAPPSGLGFDLAGTCVGRVPLDAIVTGAGIRDGDTLIALRSSGVHSNGLTLARRVLFDRAGLAAGAHIDELGRTVGEELLEPTRIYVPEVLAMLRGGLAVRGLAHITGDGLLNLTRLMTDLGFVIDALPESPPIFRVIQRLGGVEPAEMFRTFNMGVGFCVVVAPGDADRAVAVARDHGTDALVLGRASAAHPGELIVRPAALLGRKDGFFPL